MKIFLERKEEFRQRDAQCIDQPSEAAKRNIAATALDVGQIGAVHVRAPSEFLLRNAQPLSVGFHNGTKSGFEGAFTKREFILFCHVDGTILTAGTIDYE